jgi:hypothetical protein
MHFSLASMQSGAAFTLAYTFFLSFLLAVCRLILAGLRRLPRPLPVRPRKGNRAAIHRVWTWGKGLPAAFDGGGCLHFTDLPRVDMYTAFKS